MGVLGLWYPFSMCVFDIRVFDTGAALYDGIHPHKILYQHTRRKKRRYIEA